MSAHVIGEATAMAIPYKLAEAYARRDLDAILSLFADDRDIVFIGTGTDEKRIGRDQVRLQLERNLAQSDELLFRFDWVRAAARGHVAWTSAEGMLHARVAGDDLVVPVRLSGVLENVDGDFRLVQLHLSLPAAGQAEGESFPTSVLAVARAVQAERPDLRGHAAPDGTVTLLFTDIEDSTIVTERLGDQAWMDLLRTHNSIIRRHARRYGAYEVKSRGDGFMFAFQSARRAVHCAIALQRAFATHNHEHPDAPLHVRIGLHTGEAVREDDDFFGRNVILAARIAAEAPAGGVWVSSLLKALTESAGDIRFGEAREVLLKGLTGRHMLYEVHWHQE